MTSRRTTKGMTLLEVMVAIALLAVLGAMASKGLAQVIRARDVVYDEQARWRSIAMAWARMGDDVTCAVDGLPADVPQVRWRGHGAAAHWTIWGTAGSVRPVQYALRNGTLVRMLEADLSRPQDTGPGTGRTEVTVQGLETPLLGGVRAMTLSFLDDQGEWHGSWPLEGTPYARPRALRVTLVLDDGRDVTRVYALP
ncbi:type II secretion system protein GspJ [Variovorax sp. AFSI2.2]|uniref:type II secretion system protein GspJ n=1 Tax=Variovorax sp. AFSI2.2 TaxID=3384160 RepID=UPI003EB7D224